MATKSYARYQPVFQLTSPIMGHSISYVNGNIIPSVNSGDTDMKTVTKIQHSRLDSAKFAYNTASIDRSVIGTLLEGDWKPRSGDLVLARVVDLQQQKKLELPNGRQSRLFLGEEVVLCYGNQYAPGQFEAVVPHSLEVCSLVSAAGIAAKMLSYHEKRSMPTSIEPIALLGDKDGQAINLAQFSLPQIKTKTRPFTIAVVGTAIKSARTASAANLIRGLSRSGLKVGSAKITGTGAGVDVWHMTDAGAKQALDCTHAGLPSTYLAPEAEVFRVFNTLTGILAQRGVDIIIMEIADSIYQKETSRLLQSDTMREQVDSVIFAASDAMGAVAGVHWLNEQSLPVMAVCGSLTRSPLELRETRCITGLPVLDEEGLVSTNWRFLLENRFHQKDNESKYKISIDRLDAIMAMPVILAS